VQHTLLCLGLQGLFILCLLPGLCCLVQSSLLGAAMLFVGGPGWRICWLCNTDHRGCCGLCCCSFMPMYFWQSRIVGEYDGTCCGEGVMNSKGAVHALSALHQTTS
jgi:hypothetical protein